MKVVRMGEGVENKRQGGGWGLREVQKKLEATTWRLVLIMGVGEGFLCVCVLAVGDKRVGSGKNDSGEEGGACESLEVTPSINVIAWTALPSPTPTPGFFLFLLCLLVAWNIMKLII